MGYSFVDETGDYGGTSINIAAMGTIRKIVENVPDVRVLYPSLYEFVENGVTHNVAEFLKNCADLRMRSDDKDFKGLLNFLIKEAKPAKGFFAIVM